MYMKQEKKTIEVYVISCGSAARFNREPPLSPTSHFGEIKVDWSPQ